METKLRNLLDKVYELEGLVNLAMQREEAHTDFIRLIIKKSDEVKTLSHELMEEDETETGLKDNPTGFISSAKEFMLEEYSIDEESETSIPVEEFPLEEEPQKETSKEQRGKLVFSINDRFRFKKALFDNSDVDFNNTLALVASMEDYDEAEDYFINEEGFERGKPEVAEFLEIIKRYFK